MTEQKRVMDLHCDTVTDALQGGYGLGNNEAHVDLLRPPEGFGWCQTFAVFIPDDLRGQPAWDYFQKNYDFFREQMGLYTNHARQVRTTEGIDATLAQGKIAALLSVEGGAVLMGDPDRVGELARCGVKFLTITWNGPNELASGNVTDTGLTPVGRAVLARMEREGIVADVSHLNDRSFWDVVGAAARPVVATHSDSRAVRAHPRNLTDDQFRAMVEMKGLVGINFCAEFLAEGGGQEPNTPYDGGRVAPPGRVTHRDLLAHIFHFLDLGGENTVCMGSDFDGATVPDFLPGAAAFPALEQLLLEAGLGKTLTNKILFQNAFDFLARYEKGSEHP